MKALFYQIIGLLVLTPLAVTAQDAPRAFLRHPDIHGDQVVFTAEGDLWLGSLTSGTARRITTHPGLETDAHFSPDGKMLAFTAQYDGGDDVYVMPVSGGEPHRLTYDPAGATVLGWTPDGGRVLFRSQRGSAEFSGRLWSVPVGGGMSQLLPIPRGEFAAMNADGHRLAYVPVSWEGQHWFRYRGGLADDVWLADLTTGAFKRLTDDPGVDTAPVWVGNTIYFVSERDGLRNLYRLDPDTRKVSPVTHYTDYEVRYPATDGKRIVFQHGNGLALYDPAANKTQELTFSLGTDRIHARSHRVPVVGAVRGASLGPTGKRLLVEARGQILSVPAENGDARVVVAEAGCRAQYPAWSRDGKQVAFICDRAGEDQVWVGPANKIGEPRQLTHDHKGPLGPPMWSPDGKWIATGDREMRILLVDTATGATTLVDRSDRSHEYDEMDSSYRFSPDGKWLAYHKYETNWNQVVYLYDIANKKRYRISSPEMNSYNPAFDGTGKYLFFLSDRRFDPIGGGASHYFFFDKTTKVSLVTLAADTTSPFLSTNDEEGAAEPKKEETPKPKDSGTSLPMVKVEPDGIAARIVDIPIPAGYYQKVEGIDGRLLLLTAAEGPRGGDSPTPNQLLAFDLKKKETTTLVNRLTGFDISADYKKLLLASGTDFSVVDATTGPVTAGSGKVDMSGLTVEVDPSAEWKQIFGEAWRIGRDFFYDPNMHGVDWEAVKRKYAAELPAVADRSDLNEILGDMIAELTTGHAYVFGGDYGSAPPRQPMGYLGADFEPVPGANAFRVVKLFPSDEFDLEARSPLLAPGVNVKPGDYILAVGGQPVRADEDLQALLIGTAGRVISLMVNSKPTLDGAREVRVKPMADERSARYYDWVAGRREYVRTHGGENLGYVHLPDMGDGGLREFTKHYYPNLTKDGIVYDVRNNGGGYIADMLLLQMASKPYSYFKPRYGPSWTMEDWGFSGYSVAVCNEYDYSDAEVFCDAFQRLKLGPVIGVRSWGGAVGSGGGYPLVDGGRLFIPNYGEWAPDGKWVVEGTGAQPDILLEQDPGAVLAGKDPQLDRAIAYLKEQIAKHPVVRPNPPPFPNKALKSARARAN